MNLCSSLARNQKLSSPSPTSTLITPVPYPSAYRIEEMFDNRCDFNTVCLAAHRKSEEALHDEMLTRMVDTLKT